MKTDKQVIGKIGEDLAWEYLKKLGHTLRERNYLRKWGEIDIITEKNGIMRFIEVKTVTRYMCNPKIKKGSNSFYRAEENLHLYKTERLKRTIQSYLLGLKDNREVLWEFDAMIITLNKDNFSLISIDYMENIIL